MCALIAVLRSPMHRRFITDFFTRLAIICAHFPNVCGKDFALSSDNFHMVVATFRNLFETNEVVKKVGTDKASTSLKPMNDAMPAIYKKTNRILNDGCVEYHYC